VLDLGVPALPLVHVVITDRPMWYGYGTQVLCEI